MVSRPGQAGTHSGKLRGAHPHRQPSARRCAPPDPATFFPVAKKAQERTDERGHSHTRPSPAHPPPHLLPQLKRHRVVAALR